MKSPENYTQITTKHSRKLHSDHNKTFQKTTLDHNKILNLYPKKKKKKFHDRGEKLFCVGSYFSIGTVMAFG